MKDLGIFAVCHAHSVECQPQAAVEAATLNQPASQLMPHKTAFILHLVVPFLLIALFPYHCIFRASRPKGMHNIF